MYIIYHVSLFIFKADDALIIDRIRMCFSKNKITDVDSVLNKDRQIEIQYIYTDGNNIFITGNRKMLKIMRIFTWLFVWQCMNASICENFQLTNVKGHDVEMG